MFQNLAIALGVLLGGVFGSVADIAFLDPERTVKAAHKRAPIEVDEDNTVRAKRIDEDPTVKQRLPQKKLANNQIDVLIQAVEDDILEKTKKQIRPHAVGGSNTVFYFRRVRSLVQNGGKQLPKTQQELLDTVIHEMMAKTVDDSGKVRMTPNLALWNDKTKENIGQWVFDNTAQDYAAEPIASIATGSESAVYGFTSPGHDDKAIKYHAYCGDEFLDPVENTVLEAFFLDYVSGIENGALSHKIFYYSSPMDLTVPMQAGGKINGAVNCDADSVVFKETNNSIPKIRFMITQKVGLSLGKYRESLNGRKVPFREALRLGIKMVELIQKLHLNRMLHCDAHTGNFAFALGNPKKLIVIDFGRARISDPETDYPFGEETLYSNMKGPVNTFNCHTAVSYWESLDIKNSFRDDIHRVLFNLAILIYGDDFLIHVQALRNLCNNGNAQPLIDFKRSINFLSLNQVVNGNTVSVATAVQNIPNMVNHADTIEKHFQSIFDLLRATKIDEMPNYDQILFRLKQIRAFGKVVSN